MRALNQSQDEEESGYRKVKFGAGVTLLALGIVGVVWIVERLVAIGTGPQDIPLIAKFVSFDAAARTIVTPEGRYELPEGAYFAAGTVVYLIALGLVATLAKALIGAGAALIGEATATATNRLRTEMERMRQHLEKKSL
jgi:hypothetical protein